MPSEEISDPEILLNQNWDQYAKFLSSNPDSALFYGREMVRIAKISSKTDWLASANEAIAHLQYQQGFLGDAAYNYFEAAKIYTELGSLNKLANVYNSLGAIYSLSEDYKTSISYYQKASDIFQYEGTSKKKALVAINLAICHQELELFENAHDHLKRAKKFAHESNDLSLVNSISNNQGIVFSKQEKHKEAREMFLLSLEGADSLNDFKEIKATALNNIGKVFLDEGNLKEAEYLLAKAYSIKKEIGDPSFTQRTVNLLAKIKIEKGRYIEAVEFLESGLSQIDFSITEEETGQGLSLTIEALLKAAERQKDSDRDFLMQRIGHYSEKLADYNKRLLTVREKVESISKRQSIQLAEQKYSMGEELKAEKENIEELKLAFVVPVLFLLCAIASVYITFRKKQKMEKMLKAIDLVVNRGVLRR